MEFRRDIQTRKQVAHARLSASVGGAALCRRRR
jgi:hypothetical protein